MKRKRQKLDVGLPFSNVVISVSFLVTFDPEIWHQMGQVRANLSL